MDPISIIAELNKVSLIEMSKMEYEIIRNNLNLNPFQFQIKTYNTCQDNLINDIFFLYFKLCSR
jgi:tRNA1(Val) A37 N6-methylase TrmN6